MKKDNDVLFLEFPELDWLLDLGEYVVESTQHDGAKLIESKLHDAHSMLVWSRRHALAPQHSEASSICFDLMWKYNRRVYGRFLAPDEVQSINKSIRRLKEIRRERDG